MFFVYDEHLSAHSPAAPKLDPALTRAVADRDFVAVPPPSWQSGTAEVLVRVPGGGACAFILARGTTEPWLGAVLPPPHIWLAPLVAVFVTVLVAVGPLLRRIRGLSASVERSAASGYTGEIDVEGRDEVADLARAFDAAARGVREQLADRARREQALREFLANTTHDVMIPLTVLKGYLADLQERAGAEWPAGAPVLSSAMDEAHYLGALFRNLDVVARLDSGSLGLQRSAVDLGALVDRVAARHRPVARQLGVSLDCARPADDLIAEADVTLLEQAVSNVVYNALRHNRPGGHAAVILQRAGALGFQLRVLDDGPGIPAAELARITERGFRGDSARSRAPGGQGLGLSIAHRVAALHGMRLTFGPSEYGGLQVDLEGPCADPASPEPSGA